MKILVVFFSFTSTVSTLAQTIRPELESTAEVTLARIEPRRPHGYWGWLLRSFLPHARVPIKPTVIELDDFDAVCLGFPKWTVSCPPVNQYIRVMKGARGKPFALFMAYGGFDEKRYLKSITRRMNRLGVKVIARLKVKRSCIEQKRHLEAVRRFCREIRSALGA